MTKRKINWCIYYADETTFNSIQGEPWDAPATRIALIIQRHEDPRERPYFVWRDNYYLWKFGQWFAVDGRAMDHYLFYEKYDHKKAMLMGEMIPNHIWDKIVSKAILDNLE